MKLTNEQKEKVQKIVDNIHIYKERLIAVPGFDFFLEEYEKLADVLKKDNHVFFDLEGSVAYCSKQAEDYDKRLGLNTTPEESKPTDGDAPKNAAAVALGRLGGLAGKGTKKPKSAENLIKARAAKKGEKK